MHIGKTEVCAVVDAMTLLQVKNLKVGDVVYAIGYYNRDGTAQKFVVQTQPKTFKRNAERVEVNLKRGLKEIVLLTELCLGEFSMEEPESIKKSKRCNRV